MLKVLGLAAVTVLLLGSICCTQTTQKSDNTPAVATATATPASPTQTPTPAAPTTAAVTGSDFKWKDDVSGTPVTTIKVGGTIKWTIAPNSQDHRLQRVAPSPANGCDQLEPSFDSEDIGEGQSVSRTFTKVGTFGYRCGIHGGTPNCKNPPGTGSMPGVIKVVP
jgi:plastocyanin